MARDGSSGGVIRMVTIDQSGVEKQVILGTHCSLFLVFIFSLHLSSSLHHALLVELAI
jgi:hypothetical protein